MSNRGTRAVGDAGRDEIRLGHLAAARAEVGHDLGGRRVAGREKRGGHRPADRDRARGRGRNSDGREARAVVARAHHHRQLRILCQHRVDQAVDPGFALALVADAEAQVDHQGLPAGGRDADGVAHRRQDGSVAGDAAVGAVGDLEGEELGAGRDPVEAAHAVQVVPSGDAGDVGAVRVQPQDQIEGRRSEPLPEIRGQRHRRPATPEGPAKGLAAGEIVAHRPLAGQRAVSIGIGQQDPAVGRLDDEQRQGVRGVAVAVHVGRRRSTEGRLGERAGVVGTFRVEGENATEPGELPARDDDGVPPWRDSAERYSAFPREVPHVHDLRLAGRAGDQPRYAGVHPGVEDGDQHTAAVIGRVLADEGIGAGAGDRHPAMGVCDLGRRHGLDRLLRQRRGLHRPNRRGIRLGDGSSR